MQQLFWPCSCRAPGLTIFGGAHDHPNVALEDQALPPVLGLDHDVVIGEGDQANSDGTKSEQAEFHNVEDMAEI